MAMHDVNFSTHVGLEIIADKWNALILRQLTSEFIPFMELRTAIRGISTFNFLLKLEQLEELNLVTSNTDYEYRLTANGQQIQRILAHIETLGRQALNHLATEVK
ncbi:winged helix-turn-helix transcriptional regulator [Lentilactobacillus senioris]|uniref:winged helix-turn-helix transcriptional regulator n=1 Tax=Lentilactobacillus senioris TaxID=931534 RepID=UPI003D28A55D